MDIQDTYYKRLVYKKKAYEDMKSFLKFYHPSKNMLILYAEEDEGYEKFLLNIAESQNAYWCEKIKTLDKKTLTYLKNKCLNFSLIIAYGNQAICNLAKVLANARDCEYIICPNCYSLENFSCYYFEPLLKNVYKKTKYPTRIYIDEDVVKSLDLIVVGNGLKNFVGMTELLFSFGVEKKLTNFKFEEENIKKCLSRFDEIFIQITQNNDDAKLVLMDNFIEIGYYLRNFSLNQFPSYNLANMLEKINLLDNYSFDDYLLLSTDILFGLYEKILEQKQIKQFYQPDFYEISTLIEKYGFNIELYKKFEFYNNLIKNKELFIKINSLKVKIYFDLEVAIKSYKEKLRQVNIFIPTSNNPINIANVYNSVTVLPFIYQNNLFVDILAGIGALSL